MQIKHIYGRVLNMRNFLPFEPYSQLIFLDEGIQLVPIIAWVWAGILLEQFGNDFHDLLAGLVF
jgi:hypothetical protein